MSKKVLMIAYRFPPMEGIGMLRTLKFAKYLPCFSWEPLILTPKCDPSKNSNLTNPLNLQVQRTNYLDLRKLIIGEVNRSQRLQQAPRQVSTKQPKRPGLGARLKKLIKEWLFFPDEQIGWYFPAVKKGLAAVSSEQIDVIYSTSAPVTSHLIACKLKRKTGLPWVADLRDLWSQNHYMSNSKVRKWLEERLELRTLSQADALITVSEPLAKELGRLHTGMAGKIHVITNGYDPEDYQSLVRQPQKFKITYTGQLYQMKRNPEPLFIALNNLFSKNLIPRQDVELDFYGPSHAWLPEMVKHYRLGDCVQVFPQVSYQESIQRQMEASLLLLLEWDHPASVGVFTGKVFEYLGARRPILAIVPRGSVIEKLLEETGSGYSYNPGDNILALEKLILDKYREFKETGQVSYLANLTKTRQYSRKYKTAQLADILEVLSTPQGQQGGRGLFGNSEA